MAQQHKWRVAIIMAHDGEQSLEYDDLKQSILTQTRFENLSYVIFFYNQKIQKSTILEAIDKPDGKTFEIRPETTEFENEDFYSTKTLIDFFHKVVVKPDSMDSFYHYFTMTWGHGGGLYYYPSGPIKTIIEREFGNDDSSNKDFINKLSENAWLNSKQYAFLKANFSFDENNISDEYSYPFLNQGMFSDDNLFFKSESSNAILKTKINRVNTVIKDKVRLYTAVQLNEIFRKGLPQNKKAEIYFALNCNTQMLETGYEFMESVEMMVASQTTMPMGGINYFELFKKLEDLPTSCKKSVADVITDSFDIKYSTGPFATCFKNKYPGFNKARVCFSCNKLDEYDTILNALEGLTALLRVIYQEGRFSTKIDAIRDARNKCLNLVIDKEYGIIDIKNFFDNLKSKPPVGVPSEFVKFIDIFLSTKEHACISIRPPEVPIGTPGGQALENPQFLSFFAPEKGSDDNHELAYLLDKYIKATSKFNTASSWDNFIQTFYEST